jgi:hypothetical protein
LYDQIKKMYACSGVTHFFDFSVHVIRKPRTQHHSLSQIMSSDHSFGFVTGSQAALLNQIPTDGRVGPTGPTGPTRISVGAPRVPFAAYYRANDTITGPNYVTWIDSFGSFDISLLFGVEIHFATTAVYRMNFGVSGTDVTGLQLVGNGFNVIGTQSYNIVGTGRLEATFTFHFTGTPLDSVELFFTSGTVTSGITGQDYVSLTWLGSF